MSKKACFQGRLRWIGVAVVVALAIGSLGAQTPAPARTGGGRELSSDRPDATESPLTVEAGRLQLEMDVATYTRDRRDGVRTTEWVFAPFNLRYGVTADFEAGLIAVPRVQRSVQWRQGPKETVRGLGDTTLRAKWNLRGNDGGELGYGVLADLKLPTAARGIGNDRVEGALTLPVSFVLGGGWEGGAMTSGEWASTEAGRRIVWLNTLTVGRELGGEWAGFVELTSSTGDGGHVATFNCGLTRKIGSDLQLDGGVNLGLSRGAPDLMCYAGITRRY